MKKTSQQHSQRLSFQCNLMCIQAFNTENPLRIKITPSPVTPPPPSLSPVMDVACVLQTEKGIDCSLCAFHSNLELSIDVRSHNCVKLSCLYQPTCLVHQHQRGEAPREHADSSLDQKFVQTDSTGFLLLFFRCATVMTSVLRHMISSERPLTNCT